MTRKEAEAKILFHLREIDKVRKEYCPEDGYISMSILDGHLSANNSATYDNNYSKVINVWEEAES